MYFIQRGKNVKKLTHLVYFSLKSDWCTNSLWPSRAKKKKTFCKGKGVFKISVRVLVKSSKKSIWYYWWRETKMNIKSEPDILYIDFLHIARIAPFSLYVMSHFFKFRLPPCFDHRNFKNKSKNCYIWQNLVLYLTHFYRLKKLVM